MLIRLLSRKHLVRLLNSGYLKLIPVILRRTSVLKLCSVLLQETQRLGHDGQFVLFTEARLVTVSTTRYLSLRH
jgi:hypothetical protein